MIKLKIFALILAVTTLTWAQAPTPAAPAPKAEAPSAGQPSCCQHGDGKMTGCGMHHDDAKANGMDTMSEGKPMACCGGKDGKMSCGKDAKDTEASCCGGKDGKMSCLKPENASSTVKPQNSEMAACCPKGDCCAKGKDSKGGDCCAAMKQDGKAGDAGYCGAGKCGGHEHGSMHEDKPGN